MNKSQLDCLVILISVDATETSKGVKVVLLFSTWKRCTYTCMRSVHSPIDQETAQTGQIDPQTPNTHLHDFARASSYHDWITDRRSRRATQLCAKLPVGSVCQAPLDIVIRNKLTGCQAVFPTPPKGKPSLQKDYPKAVETRLSFDDSPTFTDDAALKMTCRTARIGT